MTKTIFNELKRNKFKALLIFALVFFSFFLLAVALTNSFAFDIQIAAVKSFFLTPTKSAYRMDVSYIEDIEMAGNSFFKLKSLMNEQPNTVCGAYDYSGEYFDELQSNNEFIALNTKSYEGTFRERTPSLAEVVFIDAELPAVISVGLQTDDFDPVIVNGETYLPLYIGKDFEDVLSVGDTLTLTRNGAKYMVNGILGDQNFLNDSDPVTMPPVSLNHRFLAPFSDADQTDSMSQQSTVGKIFIAGEGNIKEIVSRDAMELGIKVRVTSIENFVSAWQNDNHEVLSLNYFLACIVFVCSTLSVISTLCVTVLLNKRTYGIRIAFGETRRGIIKCIFLKNFTLIALAGAVAFLCCKFNYSVVQTGDFYEIYTETLLFVTLPILILTVVLQAVTVMLIPGVILLRNTPVSLIDSEKL